MMDVRPQDRTGDPPDHLTRWQYRRRQRRASLDRAMSIVFGVLAASILVYYLAVYGLIRSVF